MNTKFLTIRDILYVMIEGIQCKGACEDELTLQDYEDLKSLLFISLCVQALLGHLRFFEHPKSARTSCLNNFQGYWDCIMDKRR